MPESCHAASELFDGLKLALDVYRDAVSVFANAGNDSKTSEERHELESAMDTAREVWEKRSSALQDHHFDHGCRPFFVSTPQ